MERRAEMPAGGEKGTDQMAGDEKTKGDGKPKIIVDDDWKAEAQAEKDRLAAKVAKEAEQAPPAAGPAAGAGAEPGGPRELPPANFTTLVNSLATQVLMALGGVEDPETKKRYVDLDLGKFHVDTLAVLQEKTKGNLYDVESSLLDRVLYELRMNFVQISQHVAKAPPEEKKEEKKE